MKKFIPLILGIIAILNVAYSLYNVAETATIFFFDVNTWVYRAFWSILGVYMLYKFFIASKEATENL
ncbi:hypothetical protein GO491_01075 [Flavobacteriaceae bacterium Ap0902]|nr:hypothetical protein [Flavobacteriaceae bacterium Ap0902]